MCVRRYCRCRFVSGTRESRSAGKRPMPRKGAALVSCAPDSGPAARVGVTQAVAIFGTSNCFCWFATRALQACSDRVLAAPDMAADHPVAQTSLCQLEDLRRLAVRWTLSWLATEP